MYCCLFELRGHEAYRGEYLYEKAMQCLRDRTNPTDRLARMNRTQIMLLVPLICAGEAKKFASGLQAYIETALDKESACFCCAAEVKDQAVSDAVYICKQLLPNTGPHSKLTVLSYYHLEAIL